MGRHRQVCLFGTSANPPTGEGGHQGIVRGLSRLEHLDEIRVLPVFQHTFSSKRSQLASFEHRMNLCQLAFAEFPKVTVSDAEMRSFQRQMTDTMTETEIASLRVGTADLLEMLMEEEPNVDFSFCLGADTFMDLTAWKWQRSKDVLRLLEGRLIVLVRKGITTTATHLRERVELVNQTEYARQNIMLMEIPDLQRVSSSLVRSTVDPIELNGVVSPAVLEYMLAHELYGFSKAGDDGSTAT